MTCAYCHSEFDENASRLACSACVVSEGCRRLRCPECGYETPDEPAFVKRLKSWWKGRTRAASSADDVDAPVGRSRSLPDLQVGQRATVVGIDRADVGHARKLLALGVLPGTTIEVEQRAPACVFRIGRSRFAVDGDLARAVRVRAHD